MTSPHDPTTLRTLPRGPRSGGRPTKNETAQLSEDLRAAALALFLEHGYDAASVNAIARAAETTKAALYGRFSNKESLFVEVVKWAIERSDWPVPAPPPPDIGDLEAALRSIAAATLERVTNPSMICLMRAVAAQVDRFPDLAGMVFKSNWSNKEFVIRLLQHHEANGAIVVDEPEVLADNFLSLVAAGPAYQAAFGVMSDVSEQPRYTDGAIELFLRGVRPR